MCCTGLVILAATYGSVTNDTIILLLGLLAILAQVFVVATILIRLAAIKSERAAGVYEYLASTVAGIAVPLAFIVAATATAGSLFFSLHVGWQPCNFCWYQRTMIYPMAVVLGVATVKQFWGKTGGRSSVLPYAIALAIVDIPLSIYHYLLEWYPNLETSACDPQVPCSQVFLREFGYMSIPLMAGTCAITVITLLLLHRRGTRDENLTTLN